MMQKTKAETTIIHAGDIHLGAVPMGKEALGDDIAGFCRWLGVGIQTFKAELLILAGDTFDTPHPTPEDLTPILALLEIARQESCRVAIVDGNHDSTRYSRLTTKKRSKGYKSWSDCLSRAFPEVIVPSIKMEETSPQDAVNNLILLPAGLSVLPVDYAPGPVAREWMEGLRETQVKPDIMVCHQSASWATGGIFETEFDDDTVDGLAHYVAMGDIHRSLSRKRKGTVTAYSGPSTWLREPESGHEGAWLLEMNPVEGVVVMERLERKKRRVIAEVEVRKSSGQGYSLITTPEFVSQLGIVGEEDLSRIISEEGSKAFGQFSHTLAEPGDLTHSGKTLLRVLYPHDSDVVSRKSAIQFGEAISRAVRELCEVPQSIVVVSDPVDGTDVSSPTDMGEWVGDTEGQEDSVFSDDIVQRAIEKSARELSDDDEFTDKVADLAKEVWNNPGGIESVLNKKKNE